MNGALFVLKGQAGELPGHFEIPRIIPALGLLVCLGLVAVRVITGDWQAPAIAGVLLFGCIVTYGLVRPRVTTAPEP
jgi:hypothetical protein